MSPPSGCNPLTAQVALRVLRPEPLTLAWTLSPLGTRRRSHRCPSACSPPAGSGQSSLLRDWNRDNARSLPAPSPTLLPALAIPGLTVSSYNRLPRRTVPVCVAPGIRNAFTLPERKGTGVEELPSGAPVQNQVPPQELGQGFLPWGATHPLRTCLPPKQCRDMLWYTHPLGHLDGVETPASGEGQTPNHCWTLFHPLPHFLQHIKPQHRCPAAGWGSRSSW